MVLTMLFGFTAFAQNIYYQDFDNNGCPSGWSTTGEDHWYFEYNEAYSICQAGEQASHFLISPEFTLSSANSTGEMSLNVSAFTDVSGVTCAAFAVGYIVDGDFSNPTYLVQDTVMSTRRYMKVIRIQLSQLNLTSTSHSYQFVIWHIGQAALNGSGVDGAFEVDDFFLRNKNNVFAIYFDADGGTGSMPVMETSVADSSFTAPACTFTAPTGKVFAYWECYNNTTGNFEVNCLPSDYIRGVESDVTAYAIWGDVFTVTYNANGGTGTMSTQQGVQFVGHTVVANGFTRDGYSFTGWNTKSDGTGTSYAVGDILENMDNDYNLVSTSVTLYAQWTQNTGVTYTVSFDANGGSGTMTSATVNSGAAYVLPTATFTAPSGKTFFCWNTMANGTGTSYAAGSSVNVNANMTFYAQWVDDNNGGGQGGGQGGGDNGGGQGGGQGGGTTTTYTIHFAANGGTGYMNDATVEAGDYYTIPSCGFTRNGYTFLTWNTMPDGTGSTYSPGIEISIPGNITLYAIWDQNGQGGGDNGGGQGGGDNGGGQGGGTGTNYIVRYNGNGGVGTMTEQTVADNTTITLRSCQFTREGFTFTGWNTAADGTGASYNPGDVVTITSNMTFYAQWRSTNAINSVAMASVSVYPNPATTMVKVNGTNATRIDVLDLAGRTIRTAEGTNTISLNGLANGVYTLRITAAEGMALRKIVKK